MTCASSCNYILETLHVSDSSSVNHQEFFTVHTAMVYVIQVCWQLLAGSGWPWPSWSCSQAVSKPVWHIPLLCVQWRTPDDGQRNCPKHVEFHFKNKFEKLVHLVGFIIRNLSWCTVTWTSEKNYLVLLYMCSLFNPLNPELNPLCYLLALLGAHHFLHVNRIRVKLLTFRLLMSYLYRAPILDVSRSHTTTQHSR